MSNSNTDWKLLIDNFHVWKAHVVSADLVPDLELELNDRARNDGKSDPFFSMAAIPDNKIGMDMPGMAMIGRKIRSVRLDGLTIEMPSQDWVSLLADLRLKPLRKFASGIEYYKLHQRYYCLVLTPAQREDLIAAMEAQLTEAQAEGEEDDRLFAEKIRQINAGGVKVMSLRADAINNAQEGKKGSN